MLNTFAFRKKRFLSHQVGVLSFLIHEVQQPGLYVIRVLKGEKVVDELGLVCGDNESANTLNIDLAKRSSLKDGPLRVKSKGKLIFYCSKGNDEFAITILQQDKIVFESQKLDRADQFVVSPIIAGDYNVTVNSQVTQAKVKVVKGSGKRIPASQLKPVHATVQDRGLKPATVELAVGQPLVLVTTSSSRFEISLTG